ncbi:MAG: GAF domain-containing protein [Armatimonadetes bacterium]|nr:GAF domain-containing protein [Armatimonadota bacterium]
MGFSLHPSQHTIAAPGVARRTLHGLSHLLDLAATAQQSGDDTRYRALVERCADWFSAKGASLFIGVGDEYSLVARAGADERAPANASIRRGEGVGGACIADGKPRILNDLDADPELSGRGIRKRSDIGSAMVVPLIAPSGGCVGVLNLSRTPQDTPFGSDELALANSVAAYLGLSIANADLVRQLQRSLNSSSALQDQLEGILLGVGVGILAFDSRGKLVRFNPEAAHILGTDLHVGSTGKSLRCGVDPALSRAIQDALAGKISRAHGRFGPTTESGRKSWSLTAKQLQDGVVLALHDTSDLEEAQEELSRVRRLAEIGQMAAAIAHEIRNPLTGIRGAAQVIRDEPELAAEFGEIIESEVAKLNRLCEDFLDFSRPLRMVKEPMRLSESFETPIKRLRSTFDERDIELSFVSEPEEPTILADPRRLEQVAHNLLRNAMEACVPGGKVQVRINGGTAEVQDDGCGMDEEAMSNLFVPFHTSKPSGTGLGLSNVRRILDAHDAAIEVVSAKGKGTTFRLRFPTGDMA